MFQETEKNIQTKPRSQIQKVPSVKLTKHTTPDQCAKCHNKTELLVEGKKLLSQTTIKKLPVLPLLHGGNLDKESPFLLGVHLD